MGTVQRLSCFLLLTILVGCGGGGSLDGSDSSSTGDDTTDSSSTGDDGVITIIADDISLYADTQQISSDGTQDVTLTVVAKDAGNNLLEGVEVSFTSDSGAIQVNTATTGADGKATATLTTENEQANRTITVTATGSSISDSVSVQVVGTTVSLTGSSSLALNEATSYVIKVLDSNSQGIAGAEVVLTLTNQAINSGTVATIELPTSVTTDSDGQVAVEISGTLGGSNSIIATALGATSTHAVTVQADSFLFTEFDNDNSTNDGSVDPSAGVTIPEVLLSNTAAITLYWSRNGIAVANGTSVAFSSTRGTFSPTSATTVNGEVSTTITSNNSGIALLTFTGTDNAIELTNQLEFEFVAETAATIVAQASPHSIGPSGQTSTISVIVRDPTSNLVKNKQIQFDLTDTSGGAISAGTATTDSNGSASVVYTSNSVSSQDGVSIKVTVKETPSITATVTLTVADRGLFISLGTGNQLEEKDINTYTKQYTIFVTDVDSNPIKNKDLTVSAVPKSYYKGAWHRIYDADGTFERWEAKGVTDDVSRFGCINEDLNIDGILDSGEDTNGDGHLTPGNLVAALGQITTDDGGQATIDINYPQSYAHWADIRLVVTAQVSGTESSAEAVFTLPVLASDVSSEGSPPAGGTTSPFGLLGDCSTHN